MPHAPEEGLAARDAVHPQADGYAQRVGRVQERGDDAAAPPHGRGLAEGLRDAGWVAGVELPVGAEVEVDADVGEGQQGAGCEGDGAVLVVRVEAGLRGLLPAGCPGAQSAPVVLLV